MTDGAYAGLRMAARADEPDPENTETDPDDEECSSDGKSKKKDKKDMNEQDQKAAIDKAYSEGFAASNARFGKVLASDEYAGREPLAQSLLATSLSADEIITTLASAEAKPVNSAEMSDDDKKAAAEEAGRQEMKDALKESQNSDVDADAGSAPKGPAASAKIWDQAISEVIA